MKPRILFPILILIGLLAACSDILEVPDISNQQITVLAPLDGTTIPDNTINFNWEVLTDAENYRVQVAIPNFENASQFLLDSLFVKDTLGRVATRTRLLLLNGDYQWRIKGSNSGYETPFETMGFTVNGDPNADLVPPNTPVLTAHAEGTTQDETDITFSWTREDIAGTAERDSIYIYTDSSLQTLEQKGLGANKTYDATLASNTYYWVVQAFDAAGNESDDSETFQLTIN